MPAPELLLLTTDEAKGFHCLDVIPAYPDSTFARLRSEIDSAMNSWDLLVLDVASVSLRLAETSLDPSDDVTIELRRLGPVDIGVDGISGQVTAVLKDDLPYDFWEWQDGILKINAPSSERVRESYSILLE